MREYALVSHWHLAAPIDAVWDAINAVEEWPRWWRYVKSVVELQKGDASGVAEGNPFERVRASVKPPRRGARRCPRSASLAVRKPT